MEPRANAPVTLGAKVRDCLERVKDNAEGKSDDGIANHQTGGDEPNGREQ